MRKRSTIARSTGVSSFLNARKTASLAIFTLAFLVGCSILVACSGSAQAASDSAEPPVTLTLTFPNETAHIVEPGTSFTVTGELSGDIPDNAQLKAYVLDSERHALRNANATHKGTNNVNPAWYPAVNSVPAIPNFDEIALTMPEFAVADETRPQSSLHDATVKCVYTDTAFAAYFPGATDADHGLVEDDGLNLVDHDGRPYEALPKGALTVYVALTDAAGQVMASASQEIEVGSKDGIVLIEAVRALNRALADLAVASSTTEELPAV